MEAEPSESAYKNSPEVLAQRDRYVERIVANFERSGLIIMADTARAAGKLVRDVEVRPKPPATS